jgi:hypothetical protein
MTLKQVISLSPMGLRRQFVPKTPYFDETSFHYFYIELGFAIGYFEEDEDGWFMSFGDTDKKYYKYQTVQDLLGAILYGQ